MNNTIKWSIGLLAVVLVTVALLRNGGENGAAEAASIETAKLDTGDIIRSVATSGAVRPLITVEVGSQLSGQVEDIYVDFNSEVTAGQVIALIDTKTFESRVVQSRADLEVARSNVIVQRAAIDRANANLRKARLEYERAEPLAKAGTLSTSEFDTALASFESAKADLTMAEAQLQNALANEKQRQASLESAEIDLERTNIRSPIDGVVIERAVDQGQTVAASFSAPVLFRIAQDLKKIQIEANVDEADIGNVAEGNPVTFTVDAHPDDEFSGLVSQVRLAAVELNNVVTYTVIITADNPRMKLFPGMTAIVDIVTGKAEDVLRVPNQALRFSPPAGSELAAVAESGSSSQSTGGGGRMLRDLDRIGGELGLSAQQAEAIETGVQAVLDEMRPQMQSGGDPDGSAEALRSQMRSRINEVFRANLSDEQFQEYQKMRSTRQQMRSGVVWVQDDVGDIRPVNVRLGIGDDQYTQISGRDIGEGTVVVTRMRSPRG
jgi:HlyD family secretion protein